MVLQSFMKNKFIFPLFVFLFSCNTKTNIVLDEVVDQVTLDEVIKAPTEYLYGINLDSFSYITQKIKWGQSFSDILSKNGISNKDIYDASQLSNGIFNLKRIKKDNNYTLFFKKNSDKLINFVYETSKYDYVICTLEPEISFKKVDKNISYIDRQISGSIESSLYISFSNNNYPIELVNLIVDVFAWQIDFFRINPGDSYNIIYTEEIIDDEVVGVNSIKAARFTHNKNSFYAFGYDQGFGNDFFDENGKSLRKTFLRSPLKFYRISSRYKKKRFHPVLKRYRDHLGTDYAAPR